ncbi:MAG: hypothetical protein SGJ09_12830 [Phycisphaerae bacterium]|nr:hypothetical protein [Phycisphaerae bacterium]
MEATVEPELAAFADGAIAEGDDFAASLPKLAPEARPTLESTLFAPILFAPILFAPILFAPILFAPTLFASTLFAPPLVAPPLLRDGATPTAELAVPTDTRVELVVEAELLVVILFPWRRAGMKLVWI